jgi:two-component system, chemotaxis family, chemotaxis protein CheY
MSSEILVVDDSVSLRQVIKIILQKAGYVVSEAGDGLEALAAAEGRPLKLIICDLNMPNMDGLTFVKNLKSKEEHKFTPVIMLTTENGEEQKSTGMSLGVKAWLTKPFEPRQLIAAVEKLIV